MVKTALKLRALVTNYYLLIIVLVFGAFLRLYRIGEYMTFLGDEGRDAIIVRRLLLYADPILVGPGTSIGNMYLGPLYYYFMAPWLWLANFSPIGPAIGVAIFGIITIWLMYYVGNLWFGRTAGLIAALLYAVAPTVIVYSRSSWNPNIMPFFALLCMLAIWKVWQEKKYKWMLILAASFAFVMQSHYLGLLLAPVFGIFWVLTFLNARKNRSVSALLKNTAWGLLVFLFLMSPLLIFDARHAWRNVNAMKLFFTERQTTVSVKPWNAIPLAWPIFEQINASMLTAKNVVAGNIVSAILLFPLLLLVRAVRSVKLENKSRNGYVLLFVWFGIAVIGLGLYKQQIYDHYFGFVFPIPFLILGGIAQTVINSARIRGASLVIVGIGLLVVLNLMASPLLFAPNRQLQRSEEVSQKIIDESQGKPFNLAVIAERNYDDAYEYYLRVQDANVVDIDPQMSDETITDQLFVVCEMEKEKCNPTNNPKAEVANFGWSEVEQTWEVAGTILFKLVHSE
jgi:4-amino-4-deoxy-L-arabinose transferase-like glycosyltransferase